MERYQGRRGVEGRGLRRGHEKEQEAYKPGNRLGPTPTPPLLVTSASSMTTMRQRRTKFSFQMRSTWRTSPPRATRRATRRRRLRPAFSACVLVSASPSATASGLVGALANARSAATACAATSASATLSSAERLRVQSSPRRRRRATMRSRSSFVAPFGVFVRNRPPKSQKLAFY